MKARENPFRAECVTALRYRFRNTTWEELLRRLAGLKFRAALVGPKGSGKTTLLEELATRLPALGFLPKSLRLDRECPRFVAPFLNRFCAGLKPTDVVLLDGAEQMNWWAWRRFRHRTRSAGGLLITTHRPGRLPTLLECTTSPELLADILRELLPGCPQPSPEQTADLFRRHRGNLREALRELYDASIQVTREAAQPGSGTLRSPGGASVPASRARQKPRPANLYHYSQPEALASRSHFGHTESERSTKTMDDTTTRRLV